MRGTARLLRILLVTAIAVAVGVFRVWVHHDATQMGYRLAEEGARRRELRRHQEELEVELAARRSPERLAEVAARLGMAPPTPDQVLGVRGPTAGGDRGPR